MFLTYWFYIKPIGLKAENASMELAEAGSAFVPTHF